MPSSASQGHERLNNALLSCLSASSGDFAASAGVIHDSTAGFLAQAASRSTSSINNSSSSSSTEAQLRLSVLAIFQKLSGLQNGIPITLDSLHDFSLVYMSDEASTASKEARLARRIIDVVLRKKPSLVRAVETQLIPAWTELLTASQGDMQGAKTVVKSINTLSKIAQVREALQNATPFWSAVQSFYDINLPNMFNKSLQQDVAVATQIPGIKEYTFLRKSLLHLFTSFFPSLSAHTLLALLENEASNPDLPDKLTDLPLTTLVNLTLLQDAEYYHGISRQVGLRTNASNTFGQEEKSYLRNALDFTKTISKDDITDIQSTLTKGKGKSAGDTDSVQAESQKIKGMVSQVINVLPDIAVADIKRLLTSSALEQVADEQKVERVISILLEGNAVPDDTEPPHNEEADSFQPPYVPEQNKPSAFAAARSNVFADRFDISKLHRGKQDLTKDEFLPPELRASIIAAAARQAQESDEEREEAEQDDVFADLAEGDEVNVIKVKDDVSEESGMEDEELAAGVSAVATPNTRKEPSASTLGATGVPKELESLYISTYTKDSSVFARENKKTPARAELKKRIAALKLPESVADEQIEGWARMLERNPKKEKILERFGMQQWRGNEKGIEVKPASTSNSKESGDGGGGGEASRGGRGGSSGRGRGRGRGRGQSDQRRRGHDRKMQKAGL